MLINKYYDIYFCYDKIKSIKIKSFFFAGGGEFFQGLKNFLKISKK